MWGLSDFSLPQINQFPDYTAHQIFNLRDHTEPQMHQSLCQTLPANWGSFFISKQEGAHVCQGQRKSADKTRCSLASNLLKCWDRINFLLRPYPLQGGSMASITLCTGPCFFLSPGVPCSGRRIWRRMRIRKLKVTKLQSVKHACLYGLSLLKSRACGFWYGRETTTPLFQILLLSCWVLSLHWRDRWLGTTDQSKSFCLWSCLIWAHASPLLVNYTRSYWWGSTRNMQTWCDTHQSNSLIWRVIPFCSNLTCYSPSMK